jgi:hypothetical protein
MSRQVTKLSGNSTNAANAGTFYWNLNNDSANDNVNIGSQVSLFQKVTKFYSIIILASWQNIKQSLFSAGRLILESSEVK